MCECRDFTDERNKSWCIHCEAALNSIESNEDHVPTKGLLIPPRPDDLPVVTVCKQCNCSFALDEEYFITFLASVISGSSSPDSLRFPAPSRALKRSEKLRNRIDLSKQIQSSPSGDPVVIWKPEIERINNVIVKNARGHIFYEYGQPMFDPPSRVWSCPLISLTEEERLAFENMPKGPGWPEVGSMMMLRMVGEQPLSGGWVEVQKGVYRYAVSEDPVRVRTVIHDYLATEVVWDV